MPGPEVQRTWGHDGPGDRPAGPDGDDTDTVVVTRYPSGSALARRWRDDEFVAARTHRVAGVRRAQVHGLDG